jgi:hypothetical protein
LKDKSRKLSLLKHRFIVGCKCYEYPNTLKVNINNNNSIWRQIKLFAFCFLLSAKKSPLLNGVRLSAFSFCLLVLNACSRLPNVQGKGEQRLQGVWNQDSVANTSQLLSYTKHQFKISCDSFYVAITTYSKVNYYEDSCFNNGVWKEYAKGTYHVNGDTLLLNGTFTKANYKQKLAGCFRTGRYLSSFKIKLATHNQLLLESLNDQREVNLNLKEKITCVPKEL